MAIRPYPSASSARTRQSAESVLRSFGVLYLLPIRISLLPAPRRPAELRSVQKFLDTDLLPSSEIERILTGTNSHERVSRLDKDGSKVPAERADVARVLEAAAGLH